MLLLLLPYRCHLSVLHAFCALLHKQDLHRFKHNLEVQAQAVILNIHQIQLQLVVGRGIVFTVYLRVAGKTCFCLQTVGKLWYFLFVIFSDLRPLWSGPYNAHVSPQNINQLRKLVKADSSDNVPYPRNTVVIFPPPVWLRRPSLHPLSYFGIYKQKILFLPLSDVSAYRTHFRHHPV